MQISNPKPLATAKFTTVLTAAATIAALGFLTACDRNGLLFPHDEEELIAQSQPEETIQWYQTPPIDVEESKPAFAGEDIRDLVTHWKSAQNRGDYGAFAALYAESFQGLDDPAIHPDVLERTEWLNERKKAFDQSRVVALDELDIIVTEEAAVVYLAIEEWSDDRRTERMIEWVLVDEGEGLEILFEEVLDVATYEVDTVGDAPTPDAMTQVISEYVDGRQRHFLVLDASAKPEWLDDSVEFLNYSAAKATAIEKNIPERFSAWHGRRVELFDGDGEQCDARVTGLYGLARVVPHFGQVTAWRGHPTAEGPLQEPAQDREIGAQLWELSTQKSLVAEVETIDGDRCETKEDPAWARPTDSEASPLRPVQLSDTEKDAVWQAFQHLDRYEAIQQRFVEFHDHPVGDADEKEIPLWTKYRDAAHPSRQIRAFRGDKSDRTYVVATASAGGGCGGFDAAMWELFEIRGGGDNPQTIRMGGSTIEMHPRALVDVDSTGAPIIVGADHRWGTSNLLIERVGAVHRVVDEIEVDFYDCGC